MRRVVVTGLGIVSCIGNNTQEVLASLREAKSGISHAKDYADLGFRSQVHGAPTLNAEEAIDRRAMRFHGGGTAWNHVAMEQAIRDGGLESGEVSNERTGIIMGSGGPSTRAIVEAAEITRTKGPTSHLFQRLLQVRDEVLGVLDSHADADQRRRDAHPQLVLLWNVRVRHRAGMLREALGAAQAHRQLDELQGV